MACSTRQTCHNHHDAPQTLHMSTLYTPPHAGTRGAAAYCNHQRTSEKLRVRGHAWIIHLDAPRLHLWLLLGVRQRALLLLGLGLLGLLLSRQLAPLLRVPWLRAVLPTWLRLQPLGLWREDGGCCC